MVGTWQPFDYKVSFKEINGWQPCDNCDYMVSFKKINGWQPCDSVVVRKSKSKSHLTHSSFSFPPTSVLPSQFIQKSTYLSFSPTVRGVDLF
jgi:hypothetical protein